MDCSHMFYSSIASVSFGLRQRSFKGHIINPQSLHSYWSPFFLAPIECNIILNGGIDEF